MRLSSQGLEDYLAAVAAMLERYGVVLDLGPGDALELDESPSGALSFAIRGFLPDGRQPPRSLLTVRERWRPLDAATVERDEYEYELLDLERNFRRAWHLHDADAFVRRFQVVVHEHCEHPMGTAPCAHAEGSPVRDGFQGVDLLLLAWTDPTVPDCVALRCLD